MIRKKIHENNNYTTHYYTIASDSNAINVGSIPTRGKELILLPYSGSKIKRGVEFRHVMTRTGCGALGTKCLKTRFPLPTLIYVYAQREKIIV